MFNIDSLDVPYGYNGAKTVTTSGNYWDWCSVGVNCIIATACQLGTIFYPGSSIPW
jgi:hypothetical protein